MTSQPNESANPVLYTYTVCTDKEFITTKTNAQRSVRQALAKVLFICIHCCYKVTLLPAWRKIHT